MRRYLLGALVLLSAALLVGYGAAFLVRWGVRGLVGAAIFGGLLAAAASAADGRMEGAWPRLIAAGAYLLLAGYAGFTLLDAFKNDLLRDLLILQFVTGVVGLLVCAWPRPLASRWLSDG